MGKGGWRDRERFRPRIINSLSVMATGLPPPASPRNEPDEVDVFGLIARPFLVGGVLLVTAQKLWEELDQPFPFGPCLSGIWANIVSNCCLLWLAYATGLVDEGWRIFLGLRLTKGLGAPTTVGHFWSSLSARAKVIVEDLSVQDFSALSNLYVPNPPLQSLAPFDAAISASDLQEGVLVRVSHLSGICSLSSFAPWSRVRRYQQVQVQGATLFLRQFKGILNFSFLALEQSKQQHEEGMIEDRGDVVVWQGDTRGVQGESGRYNEPNPTPGSSRDLCPSGMSRIPIKGESRSNLGLSVEGTNAGPEPRVVVGTEGVQAWARDTEESGQTTVVGSSNKYTQRNMVESMCNTSPSPARPPLLWPTMCPNGKGGEIVEASTVGPLKYLGYMFLQQFRKYRHWVSWDFQARREGSSSWKMWPFNHPADYISRQCNKSEAPNPNRSSGGGRLEVGAEVGCVEKRGRTKLGENCPRRGRRTIGNESSSSPSPIRSARSVVGMHSSGGGERRTSAVGSLKVLGEAFMRRFRAYIDQVGATFDRVARIKLVPSFSEKLKEQWLGASKKNRPLFFEVEEVVLKDIVVCVGAGVWRDLLGEHVGKNFSPEFRLDVHVGPQELTTADGKGRRASDIGSIVNDKFVKLLSTMVLKEALKTSTFASVVIESLALDTEARGRERSMAGMAGMAVGGSRAGPWGGVRGGSGGLSVDGDEDANRKGMQEGVPPWGTISDGIGTAQRSTPPQPALSLPSKKGGGTDHGTSSAGKGRWRLRNKKRGDDVNVSYGGKKRLAKRGSAMDGLASGGEMDSGVGEGAVAGVGTAGTDVRSRRVWGRSGSSAPAKRKSSLPRRLVGNSNSPLKKLGGQKPWEKGGTSECGGAGAPVGAGVGASVGGGQQSGTMMRGPSWIEGVEVPTDYDEIKPALDVIKRTVLLALLQQSMIGGDSGHGSGTKQGFSSPGMVEDGGHDGDEEGNTLVTSPSGGTAVSGVVGGGLGGGGVGTGMEEEKELVQKQMEKELEETSAAGGDVDKLVMDVLLYRVREVGPKHALKALASIEMSSLLETLAKETRFSGVMESMGMDVHQTAKSMAGITAGSLLETAKARAGKVGIKVHRLRSEAARVQKDLLDDAVIPFLLEDPPGVTLPCNQTVPDATSTATTVIPGPTSVEVGGIAWAGGLHPCTSSSHLKSSASLGSSMSPAGKKDSVEADMGVEGGCGARGAEAKAAAATAAAAAAAAAASAATKVMVRVTGGTVAGVAGGGGAPGAAGGDAQEPGDEVSDVITQVLDLLEAVECLKGGIVAAGEETMGKVERALGRAAQQVDVYLILAVGDSILGFLLDGLGNLPVGQTSFVGKGVNCRLWNLDLKGVHVAKEGVNLAMMGYRLPKRGTPVMTKMGSGCIKRYKKRTRCFVVNLDWKLGNGAHVKAYLQPKDITILEGCEGELSDSDEEDCKDKPFTVDDFVAGHRPMSARDNDVGINHCGGSEDGGSVETDVTDKGRDSGTLHGGVGQRGRGHAWNWGWGWGAKGQDASDKSRNGLGEEQGQGGAGRMLPMPASKSVLVPNEVKCFGSSSSSCSSPAFVTPKPKPPFLTVRMSNMSAELRDVKWSVKQMSFPGIKTAGTASATVASLGILLELDTVDLNADGKERSIGDENTAQGRAGLGSEGGGGGGRKADPSSSPDSVEGSKDLDNPRGLHISRLRVSVGGVTIRVSESHLSGLYNLIASAFEASIKQHVAEQTEQAVRKNVGALLTLVNEQVAERWGMLRRAAEVAALAAPCSAIAVCTDTLEDRSGLAAGRLRWAYGTRSTNNTALLSSDLGLSGSGMDRNTNTWPGKGGGEDCVGKGSVTDADRQGSGIVKGGIGRLLSAGVKDHDCVVGAGGLEREKEDAVNPNSKSVGRSGGVDVLLGAAPSGCDSGERGVSVERTVGEVGVDGIQQCGSDKTSKPSKALKRRWTWKGMPSTDQSQELLHVQGSTISKRVNSATSVMSGSGAEGIIGRSLDSTERTTVVKKKHLSIRTLLRRVSKESTTSSSSMVEVGEESLLQMGSELDLVQLQPAFFDETSLGDQGGRKEELQEGDGATSALRGSRPIIGTSRLSRANSDVSVDCIDSVTASDHSPPARRKSMQ